MVPIQNADQGMKKLFTVLTGEHVAFTTDTSYRHVIPQGCSMAGILGSVIKMSTNAWAIGTFCL